MNLDELREELKPLKKDLRTITEGLLDPDKGLFTRVKKNTSWRKVHQKIYWIFLAALIIGVIQHFV